MVGAICTFWAWAGLRLQSARASVARSAPVGGQSSPDMKWWETPRGAEPVAGEALLSDSSSFHLPPSPPPPLKKCAAAPSLGHPQGNTSSEKFYTTQHPHRSQSTSPRPPNAGTESAAPPHAYSYNAACSRLLWPRWLIRLSLPSSSPSNDRRGLPR